MSSSETQLLDPVEKNAFVNGVRITYFERGMSFRGQKPTLLFFHATGFHARIWDKIINALGDYHSISVDQRGHGRSEKKKIHHWDEAVADAAQFIEQLGLTNIIGIGHSMGGHALVGAAGRVQHRFLKLIAIDPVILAEQAYDDKGDPLVDASDYPTAKRRNEFDSPEDMAERLRGKGSFGIFDPDMFMDYCRYGLLPNEKGKGYVLACPPEIETSVYISSRSNQAIYEAIHELTIPVLILRAKEMTEDHQAMDFSFSPTWPELVKEFKNGREIHFADNTHLLPMEIPAQITEIIQEELADA